MFVRLLAAKCKSLLHYFSQTFLLTTFFGYSVFLVVFKWWFINQETLGKDGKDKNIVYMLLGMWRIKRGEE